MPNKNKRRGVAAEGRIRDKLTALGIPTKRVYASGAGKLYSKELEGDLRVATILGELRGEVKMRKGGKGWQVLKKWMGDNDLLFLLEPHREPLVMMRLGQFVACAKPLESQSLTQRLASLQTEPTEASAPPS